MPKFGSRSRKALATCDEKLQKVFNEVIKHIDCSVLEGHRDEFRQDKFFKEGKSKVKYPNGRHNTHPSVAVDVTPYPVDWADRERQTLFAGFVMGVARSMGIGLRWGGDWDGDWEVQDNKFDDFPHFELADKAYINKIKQKQFTVVPEDDDPIFKVKEPKVDEPKKEPVKKTKKVKKVKKDE